MSAARKRKKLAMALIQQANWYMDMYRADPFPLRLGEPITEESAQEFVAHEMHGFESPYDALGQKRFERRIYGHDIYSPDCTCTAHDIDNLALWNQPPRLWMDMSGHKYHRKTLNRRGRNR